MYRMAVMALVAGLGEGGVAAGTGAASTPGDGSPASPPPPPLDVSKCVLLALAHDVAEAIVGDIAPGDGVSKADKAAREAAAMDSIRAMLGGGPAADALAAAFEEYEAGESREAVLVKDLDKVEMVLQAGEYERAAVAAGEAAGGEGGVVVVTVAGVPAPARWTCQSSSTACAGGWPRPWRRPGWRRRRRGGRRRRGAGAGE